MKQFYDSMEKSSLKYFEDEYKSFTTHDDDSDDHHHVDVNNVVDLDDGYSSDSSFEDYYLHSVEEHQRKLLIRQQFIKKGLRPIRFRNIPINAPRLDQFVDDSPSMIKESSEGSSSDDEKTSTDHHHQGEKILMMNPDMPSSSFSPSNLMIPRKKRSPTPRRIHQNHPRLIITNPAPPKSSSPTEPSPTSLKLVRTTKNPNQDSVSTDHDDQDKREGNHASSSSKRRRTNYKESINDTSPRCVLELKPDHQDQHNDRHITVNEAMVAVYGGEAQGLQPELVFERLLTKTDANCHHHRLMIPERQARRHLLLTPEEVRLFRLNHTVYEVAAMLVDFKGNKYEVRVKMQKMREDCFCYTIPKPWNEIRIKAGLQKESPIQLWAFRRPGSVLGFFLDKNQ